VLGVRDGDTRANRIASAEKCPEVGPERHPERGYYEVVPAAMAAPAAATTNLARSRLVGAQRARATAHSSFIRPGYRGSSALADRQRRSVLRRHGRTAETNIKPPGRRSVSDGTPRGETVALSRLWPLVRSWSRRGFAVIR
jgi:hypothetical protein